MRIHRDVSEAFMVAAFLKAEVDSPRWCKYILDPLSQAGITRSIIDTPNLLNLKDNEFRSDLLGYRGFKRNDGLFAGFPSNVKWKAISIDFEGLNRVKVINQAPWPEFSGGSSLAVDAARNLRSSTPPHAVMKDILAVASLFHNGTSVPDIILVGTSLDDPLVIIEGHVRVMAAFLENGIELSALVGLSSDMSSWKFY